MICALVEGWGANWGNGGFFRMERGVNLCKMEAMELSRHPLRDIEAYLAALDTPDSSGGASSATVP